MMKEEQMRGDEGKGVDSNADAGAADAAAGAGAAFVAQPVDDGKEEGANPSSSSSDRRWSDKIDNTMSTQDDDDDDDNDDANSEEEEDNDHNNDRMKNLIPTSQEELKEVERHHGKNSWQLKAIKFINSRTVQRILISLLLLDVLILFVELYLDAAFPACHIIERDAISCCPDQHHHDDNNNKTKSASAYDDGHHRYLSSSFDSSIVRILAGGGGDGHHPVCEYPLHDTDYDAGCDEHKYHGVHKAHDILFLFTIIILSIFQVELLILLITLGPCTFFSHFMYVLDFVVVTASLGMEIGFATMDEETFASLAGLLVMARIWRFVRIGHGLVASATELEAHKRKDQDKYIKALEKELMKHKLDLPEDCRKSSRRSKRSIKSRKSTMDVMI